VVLDRASASIDQREALQIYSKVATPSPEASMKSLAG
jgi:hypothetical protein